MNTLRKKILGGYLLILVLMGCSGILAFQKISELTVRVEDMSNNLSAKLISAKDIAYHSTLAGEYAQSFAVSGGTSDHNSFKRHMKSLQESIQTFESKPVERLEQAKLSNIKIVSTKYNDGFSNLARLIDQRQSIIFGPLNETRFKIEKRLSALRVGISAGSDINLFFSLGNAQDAFLRMLLYTSEYIRTGDERFGVLFDKAFNKALASYDNMKSAFADPVEHKNIEKARASVQAYNKWFNEVRQGVRKQIRLLREMFDILEPQIARDSAELVTNVETLYLNHNQQTPEIFARTRNTLIMFSAIAVVFGVAIGFILSRKITRPLKEVMNTSKQIADKDLDMLTRQMASLARGDVRLAFHVKSGPLTIRSADEVGETARAFNKIIYQLLEAEKAFSDMAGYLSGMTQTALTIAKGDLSVRVKKQSGHDLLGNALSMMTDHLTSAKENVEQYQDGLETLVKKRTEDLEESRRLLHTLMGNLPGMAYRCLNDRDWSMEFVSEGALDLTGYSPRNIIMNRDVSYGDLVHPDDRDKVWEGVQAAIELRTSYVLLYRIITKQAQTKWVWEKGRGIFDKDNCLVALEGFISDITEHKKTEQSLRESQTRLNQAQKREAIGTLAGGIAHDFNNILSGLFGYSQLIGIHNSNPEKVKEYNDRIVEGAQRASELVQQILTFTRNTESSMQPLNLFPILKEVLKLLRSTIPSNIEIKENLINDPVILADPTQIHQVIMNLCTNAYHAMGDDGGVMTVGLDEARLNQGHLPRGKQFIPGQYLRLEVRDTGSGIDCQIKEKIFDPYFTTKEKGKGTGLGLAVVDGIVKTHNGFLEFDSKPGRGTVFNIYFPVIERERKRTRHKEKKDTFSPGSGTIMLVDDEDSILKTLKAILERQGYEIKAFNNGESALEAFSKSPDTFDLIITDMTMPKMTGDKLSGQALKIRKDIPIVLCTGYHQSFTNADAMKVGIKSFVQKPVSTRQLLKTINEVLGTP